MAKQASQIRKVATGIPGLDGITGGGLPAGRPTLVCGGPGSGKTLLATSFLVEGALHAGEPGVFVSFDERPVDLAANTQSLGFDLPGLQAKGLLVIDHVHLDRQEIHETGDYDLEGLFIRLGAAVDQVKARRVVLDSIDTLFAGIPNAGIIRSELRRLFAWLKDRDLSTVITAERGEGALTRNGIEEYVSDCVILLDQRMQEELATRRLRIVKYRGTAHGSNEYPFLIDETGLILLPVTSLGFEHPISEKRLSTGIAGLDDMLEGEGYYKGSSILVSGGPGTGKTSIGATFAYASVQRGERCLLCAFEESEGQLVRNMRTIGIDLQPAIAKGNLIVSAVRPTAYGLEMHLARIMQIVHQKKPDVVILDPISALLGSGSSHQAMLMVLRLIDHLKSAGATALCLSVQGDVDQTDLNISSLTDTWITIKNVREEAKLERRIFVVKSRGMAHSAEVRQIVIGAKGVQVSGREGRA